MNKIKELTLDNIRCFVSPQTAKIARFTLLVGENSTGKSSFMGSFKTFAKLSDLDKKEISAPFNLPPFYMGTYSELANDRSRDIKISGRFEDDDLSRASFTFKQDCKGNMVDKEVEFQFPKNSTSKPDIRISRLNDHSDVDPRIKVQGLNFELQFSWANISKLGILKWLTDYAVHGYLPFSGNRHNYLKNINYIHNNDDLTSNFTKFGNFFRSGKLNRPKSTLFIESLDPYIIRRERKYKQLPEYFKSLDKDQIEEEHEKLNLMGQELGLWNGIKVSITKDNEKQIMVDTSKGYHNLIDVGYGIHSLLNICLAISFQKKICSFTLQQPEVHIHPVAQSKLAKYIVHTDHQYLIETHSDHMIDELRLCVKNGIISCEDLVILYFDNSCSETTIHSIQVNEQGNILNPPVGYRDFFIQQTDRLLGII